MVNMVNIILARYQSVSIYFHLYLSVVWRLSSIFNLFYSPQVSEGHLKLQLLLRQRLHLLDEVLEGRLQFMPHLPLHLLGVQVVSIVHMLVFAQVCGDLADLGVELNVCVASLTKHDGVLEET